LYDFGTTFSSSPLAIRGEITDLQMTFEAITINIFERKRVPSLGKEAFLDPC
jgi:hypothetical protein